MQLKLCSLSVQVAVLAAQKDFKSLVFLSFYLFPVQWGDFPFTLK